MTITIYGAGAIGGLAGAYMARAGEDVLFVDKVAEHVDAINRRGLEITGGDSFKVPARACLPEDLKGPLGLTFLAVKSQDTAAALEVLAPLAGPETVVVSLQNGMNPPAIAERLGAERVIAAFVNYGADWLGPGQIEHGGKGSVYIGELDGRITDRLLNVQRLLTHLHTCHVTENVYGYLWSKQIDAAMLFAQATTDETIGDTLGNYQYQPLLAALVNEGVAVAAAAGVKLESFDSFEPLKLRMRNEAEEAEARAVLNRFADRARAKVKVRSGVWRDLAVRRRPTEVTHIVGAVAAEGKKRGVATPLLDHLVMQIKELEQGVRQRSMANLAELERLRGLK